MRPEKMAMNGYPPSGAGVSIYDFVMDPNCGIPRIIDFMNLWARELPKVEHLLTVRYEDMRTQPQTELTRIIRFFDMEPDDRLINDAVEFASVENLRKLEKDNYYSSGSRVKAKDSSNPDSFKVRIAKVGGYRDYFDDEQLKEIDDLVDLRLSEIFDYGTRKSASNYTDSPDTANSDI